MEKWKIYGKKENFERIGNKFNIDPVIARIIRNRDIVGDENVEMYLNADKSKLYSPNLMKDMEKVVSIILDAVSSDKKIRVIGDYDIDGVCSGHILTSGLERIGVNVDFEVPDRISDGYGINGRIIKKAYDDNVELILTCDNGIAAIEQIDYAKSLGMEVVVTDHHEIMFTEENGHTEYLLPKADAIVNPKQPDDKYPFKELCGGGVAYKLIWALYERMGLDSSEWEKYLEYAAVATIGDVVDLKGENRILAVEGMKQLNETKSIGFSELIKITGLSDRKITSYHIGFVIGPCLNAGGRLDTAMKSYRLLHTESKEEAALLAEELKNLNDERKDMTLKGVEKAVSIIEKDETYKNDSILVVKLDGCHESIAGIIAGRIREKYNKPVFILTDAENGLKGSGRSIEEYNMFDELVKCRHLFQKFGGHEMAAGISIEPNNFQELRKTLNMNAALTEEDLCRKIWIDVPMPFTYITDKLVRQLNMLEPFGKGNEKPVFAQKNVKVGRISIFGKNRNVVKMGLIGEMGFQIDGIYFGDSDKLLEDLSEKFSNEDVEKAVQGEKNNISLSVLYYPEINEFNGKTNLRVVIKRYL